MAEGDPLLGEQDAWRGDEIELEDGVPILYHQDSSYFSMIARLCLEEKQTPWRSRLTDIHKKMEHLEPWYLAISPGGCVPTLVTASTVVPESLDIIRFIDANLAGGISLTPKDTELRQRMEHFIKLHYSFEVEDLTLSYLMMTILPIRVMMPKMMAGTVPRLKALKKEHPEIKETIDRKIKQNNARVEKFKNYEELYESTEEKVLDALDELENTLSSGGPFICGEEYTLADVLFTCLLCRAVWAKPLVAEIEERPHVAEYWDMVQSRPSFESADMWPSMRPGKIIGMLGPKLALPCCCCCCVVLPALVLLALYLCRVISV